MNLVVKIQLSQEWLEEMGRHPQIRRQMKSILSNAINVALVGRGKVLIIKEE